MERPSSDERPRGPPFGIPRGFLALVSGTLVLGVGHHVDHIVRGNHVGWPLTGDVNAFTFSLLAYPLIAVGFAVGFDRRRGLPYWTLALLAAAGLVILTHFGPLAVEPPADILGAYESRLAGLLAFAWLLVFAFVLAGTFLAAVLAWRRSEPGNG